MEIVKNPVILQKWRQSLNNVPIESPFSPYPLVTETLHEITLEAMKKHAISRPNDHAIIDPADGNRTISYDEAAKQSLSVAAFLKSRSFKIGQVVSVVIPNCIELPIINIGIWSVGGITSVKTDSDMTYELEHQFIDSECTIVFTCEEFHGKVQEVIPKCPLIQTIVCIPSSNIVLPNGIIDWSEVIAHNPIDEVLKVPLDYGAVLLYSWGTTGIHKGALHTHRTMGNSLRLLASHYENEVYTHLSKSEAFDWTKECLIANNSCGRILGFTLLHSHLIVGSTIIITRCNDMEKPIRYLENIEKYRPRVLYCTPPFVLFMAKLALVSDYDLSSVECVNCAAAPLGKDLSTAFLKRHPYIKYLKQMYGMTEIGGACLPLLESNELDASAGITASRVQQKIIDLVTGEPVKLGDFGEICIKSPTIIKGYLNRPMATSELIDSEGWAHTGDIGYMDVTGRVFIVDRLKEVIKSMALQVAPAEIEDLLLSHPKIADVAVVGIPDPEKCELVRAYVVKSDESLVENEVKSLVAENLADFKHLTGGVRFIDKIPKNATGKILRRVLRDMEA